MSFYNMMFGMNPNTEMILALVKLKKCDIERFRDCSIDFENQEIQVYTRTGGGNREDYPNELLTNNPYYKHDEDDDFDYTYATYYFNFPKEIEDDILNLQDIEKNGIGGKLIGWISEVNNREKTENDIFQDNYDEQIKLLKSLQDSSYGMINYATFNGHTLIPLNDRTMDRLLDAAEKADGIFHPYAIRPYNVIVKENSLKYKSDKNNICRICLNTDWKVDNETWERYKRKFAEAYPKSIAYIEERLVIED